MDKPDNPRARRVAEILDAQRGERVRIADALHDGALQHLFSIRQDIGELQAGDRRAVASLRLSIESLADELRALTASLHADALDQLPLAVALQRIAASASLMGRFQSRVRVGEDAAGINDNIVRSVVRELLHNASRHARATNVTVNVARYGDAVQIEVSDDGHGFTPAEAAAAEDAGHLGLGRLRRLAADLDGRFDIEGSPEYGTRATVQFAVADLETQAIIAADIRRGWSGTTGVIEADPLLVLADAHIVQVNDAFCELTGFARHELLGAREPAYPFWSPADTAEQLQIMQASNAAGDVAGVVRLTHADGSRVDASVTTTRVDAQGGDQSAMLAIFRRRGNARKPTTMAPTTSVNGR